MATTSGAQELTGRACVRAVSPKKWARLMADWVERQELDKDAAERTVAAALLYHIVKPHSPALLIGYLSQALATGLFTAREFALAVLVHLHRADASAFSIALHGSVAAALLANPTGLDVSQPLVSPIALDDIPDIGTSASAEPGEVSALALIIPLLRQCAAGPASPHLLALAARLTALIPALPPPPFDAGLEAAQLSALLPEEVAKPLRDCLSGLMSELPLPAAQPTQGLKMYGDSMPINYNDLMDGQLPSLASLQGQSSLPLHHMIGVLLEYTDRAEAWTRNASSDSDPPTPAPHLIALLRLGRALTKDPQAYLSALLDAAVTRLVNSSNANDGSASVRAFVLFTEQLPVLLAWWQANADGKWQFPPNFQSTLSTVFLSRSQELSNWFQTVSTTYSSKTSSQVETLDEADAYTQPEGWSLVSVESATVRRYVSLGLLDEESATALCGSPQRSLPPGESLLERIANASQQHLEAVTYLACYAAGAGRSFGGEVVNMITNAPHAQPPEGFVVRLASSPELIALVTAYITPASLLDLCTKNLLDHQEDISVRQEDPQSCLTRFGAGVMLVEALCWQFELPLPDLLHDSRLACTLGDLTSSEQSHLNSWVKALFGSDGIDDEVVLATSSQGLCRLASTLVQQAIIADMSGQIDSDTLHSGLSYFAQPLLSWCLGGVVGWLCAEIERQGALSAVHLNVLQTLVLDTAFPEPLLRANAKALSRLLDPLSGLQAVFESSEFGAPAIQDKIQSVGGVPGGTLQPTDTTSLTSILRSELHNVRQLDLAPPGWEVRILDALTAALRSQGPLRVLESVMNDIIYPMMESDPLVQFLGLLCALHLPDQLAGALVDGYFPSLFGLRSAFIPAPRIKPSLMSANLPQLQQPPPLPFSAQAIHKLLKATLLAADATSPETADELASHLGDELAFQRVRPGTTKPTKRLKEDSRLPPLSSEQRELICLLQSLFEGDEELRARWPALAPLITT